MKSWRGTLEIIRFNWPSYVFAGVVSGLSLWMVTVPELRAWGGAALALTLYFTLASILASHWIYDCSRFADGSWVHHDLKFPIGRNLVIQAGFDATHGTLSAALPADSSVVFDLYGIPGMGGVSVERARRSVTQCPAIPTSVLPTDPLSRDTILGVFALHEIQSPKERAAFFAALTNLLIPGGRLVVVEHLRDWKNFLVFGCGFLHFQSEREWRRCAAAAGLTFECQASLTPFVQIMIWRKS